MEDATLKLGLLMEAAHAQQGLAETTLARLETYMKDLDDIVREAVRRTLTEELRVLGDDSRRAAESLRRLSRSANMRATVWSVAITALAAAIPVCGAWCLLPSRAEVAALRAKREELTVAVARLERRGGRIDLRRCGNNARLCVRVDRKAPVYGPTADYFVVEGY